EHCQARGVAAQRGGPLPGWSPGLRALAELSPGLDLLLQLFLVRKDRAELLAAGEALHIFNKLRVRRRGQRRWAAGAGTQTHEGVEERRSSELLFATLGRDAELLEKTAQQDPLSRREAHLLGTELGCLYTCLVEAS